jgi:cytidylate kinase
VSAEGRLFVAVAGPPASGKSTVAPALAAALGLPVIAKDTIKEALMSILPVPDVAASRQVGRASVQAMFAVAAASPIGAVLESNFYRGYATPKVQALPGVVVEVFCRCPPEVRLARYRARTGSRHAGHLDGLRTDEELQSPEISEPIAAGWSVIEIDTTAPVDVGALAERVKSEAKGI